jgi:hypothetical protein
MKDIHHAFSILKPGRALREKSNSLARMRLHALPLLLLLAIALAFRPPARAQSTCGDGVCDPGETWPVCPQDCGANHPADVRQEEATYGITVLNLDADSGVPLAGWTTRLYAGPGCTGSALQTGLTGADGLASFTGLAVGAYSVQAALQPGYISVSPLCQDVALAPSLQGSGLASSLATYPPAGDDTYAAGAYLVLQLGTQPADAVTLNGPLVLHRSDPGDANRNGLDDIQTQVLSMTLSGDSSLYGPLSLRRRAAVGATGAAPQPPLVPQAVPWTDRAEYLIVDNGVVAEGGSAFSFGGHNDVSCVTDLRRWDPGGAVGTWTDLAPLPEVLDAPRGVLVDSKIYIPGGWDCDGVPKDVLYIYDVAANTWSMGASPPSGRAAYGIAAVDGSIYRIGGCADAACTPSADVDVYDVDTDTWSSGASYPIDVAWQVCGALEGEIYCAGGYDGVGPTHKAYRYLPLPIDTWSDSAMIDLCRPWWAMGAGDNAVDAGGLQSLYLYGGIVDGFEAVTDLAVHYDKATNRWYYFEPLNFAVYRQGGGSANSPLGNQYSVGGLLPLNPPGVGFSRDAPAGGYHVQHYPTIPPAYSPCDGPPTVILPEGLLEELRPAIPFPAGGRWNLFFDLDVGGLDAGGRSPATLHNTSPLQARGTVSAIPLDQQVFRYGGGDPGASPLPLFNSNGQEAGFVQQLHLVTLSPGNTLVAFANRQTTAPRYYVYGPLIARTAQSAASPFAAGDGYGNGPLSASFDRDRYADLAVGVPREALGDLTSAGVVHILYSASTGLSARGSQFWDQDDPGILDTPEEFDHFGYAPATGGFDGTATSTWR